MGPEKAHRGSKELTAWGPKQIRVQVEKRAYWGSKELTEAYRELSLKKNLAPIGVQRKMQPLAVPEILGRHKLH